MAYDLTTVIGGGGGIKAVQRGIAYTSGTSIDVTITAVDLNKSFVTISNEGDNDTLRSFFYGYLTTTTNLHIERRVSANTVPIAWEVVEFA